MAATKHTGERVDELVKYMKALVLLQLQTSDIEKPEVLLVRAGFNHREIGDLIGKSQMAVAKAVSRAKSASRGGEDGER